MKQVHTLTFFNRFGPKALARSVISVTALAQTGASEAPMWNISRRSGSSPISLSSSRVYSTLSLALRFPSRK
jgi:hypothetical protein